MCHCGDRGVVGQLVVTSEPWFCYPLWGEDWALGWGGGQCPGAQCPRSQFCSEADALGLGC